MVFVLALLAWCRTLRAVAALEDEVDQLADETGFSGCVRVDDGDGLVLAKAYGMAHRGLQVANTVDTQFGLASAVKGMTAIAVVSLIVDGALELVDARSRSVLGSDLPLIADDVTIEHLLSHRSGIGDYLDEDVGYDISRLRDAGPGSPSWPRRSSTSRCSTATRPSSPQASSSRTATAVSSCWR